VVDFGTVPAAQVTFVSAFLLTAVSPPLAGTVDVRVTNNFGTSAITPLDQFTAPPPALAPAVTAISPISGPAEGGYTVTITGTGFTSDCKIFFGDNQALLDQTIIMSLTEINVPPPTSGSGTVAVTVTTTGEPGSAGTPTFTFGSPVVTGVNPSFGLLGKTADNPQVTITGAGFGSSQGNGTVQFAFSSDTPILPQSISSWSDKEIVVIPPNVQGVKNAVFDVTVTNTAGLTSDTTPVDQYTYYNSAGLQS